MLRTVGTRWRPSARAILVSVQVALVFGFLVSVTGFFESGKGFTRLIAFGSRHEEGALTAVRETPHIVLGNSSGYDGQFYAQVAIDPLLRDPALPDALDAFGYRARRILMPAVAHFAGLGRPAWILQAYALLNVACWLALALLLFRWFHPGGLQGLVRWGGVLFSVGMLLSVRYALPDGPALLLVAIALALCGSGRMKSGTVSLALAALTKETAVLAATLLPSAEDMRQRRVLKVLGGAFAVVLPLFIWILYVNSRVDGISGTNASGVGNFSLPLSGWAQAWLETFRWGDWTARSWINQMAVMTAISVQAGFFLFRWRWRDRRWRLGAVYALLGLFLGAAVWEGIPGAAPRILLPLTLAFNLAVPVGWKWFPVLLLGNLSVIAAPTTLDAPAVDRFAYVSGPSALTETEAGSLWEIEFSPEWYIMEKSGKGQWRWSPGDASITIRNRSSRTFEADLKVVLRAREQCALTLGLDGEDFWSGRLTGAETMLKTTTRFPPGDTVLEFEGADPPSPASARDQRIILFRLNALEVRVIREIPYGE